MVTRYASIFFQVIFADEACVALAPHFGQGSATVALHFGCTTALSAE
jgi:hypothetical protein